MGNCCTAHAGRKRSRYRRKRLKATTIHHSNHEGLKKVVVENFCKSLDDSVICLCILTWNMNGKVSSKDFLELIDGNRSIDLFVVGLQEVPRRNIARLLKTVLFDSHRLVGEAIMQSLQLFVFGHKNSEVSTREVKVEKHAVGGFGGLIGRKKGAVTVSLIYKGVRMQFISCHLSAHARNVERRNSEWWFISQALLTNRNPYARQPHITIWLGDLNYRIQGIDALPAKNLIQRNLYSLLTGKDQLLREAERGQIFSGYCEGALAFKPTYKYNVGSSNYDSSYKGRVPSWTDRILFKLEKLGDIDVALQSYESIDSINSSDHKPVRAHLCLRVNNP